MTDLAARLDNLQPVPVVRVFIEELGTQHAVAPDRRAGYVSLRPTLRDPIAVYVHRNRISIAITPPDAEAAASRIDGAEIVRATPATSYVILTAAALQGREAIAFELALAALQWRANGVRRGLGTGGRDASTAVEPDLCPDCWTELSASGSCFCE
ncbi:hypothetical protein [Actinoplanes sp. NPDC026619]|uniref:hypothetical protein n=1 Tax=Actinoplanes sp. NPDC026619 TaxID=3155798 RepID=UPI003411E1B1